MPEPPDHVKEMGEEAAQAYRDAFRGCVSQHDGEEKGEDHNCFAIATQAAKDAQGSD